MKIKCNCGNLIVDQTDGLKSKGYIISDEYYFDFWNRIDEAIETPSFSNKEREERCTQLRQKNFFNIIYECQNCGKLFFYNKNNTLITFSPDNDIYNSVLNKEN